MRVQTSLEGTGGVLRALIVMEDEATIIWRTLPANRLLHRIERDLGTGMRTFLWTGYAASPRLLRCCIGLIQPSFSFGRSSL